MTIDYQQWAQHTIAEARYGGRESAIHIRIPAINVQVARELFSNGDGQTLESHIDLSQQPYQLHLFNSNNKDGYITQIPFKNLRAVLWYLHINPDVREELMSSGEVKFLDFLAEHNVSGHPGGTPKLYHGHEKYGFLDLIPTNSFLTQQLHRAILYGAFLQEHAKNFGEDGLKQTLPHNIREYIQQGDELPDAILKSLSNGTNGHNTVYSKLEKLTLVVDGASDAKKESNLRVCVDHEYPIYWANIHGRRVYRIINLEDIRSGNIKDRLNGVPEESCPICVATKPST